MKKFLILCIACAAFVLYGCSMGQSKSFCEKEGCDYRKAGVCHNAYDVFADRYGTIAEAYKGTPCKR